MKVNEIYNCNYCGLSLSKHYFKKLNFEIIELENADELICDTCNERNRDNNNNKKASN